MKRHKQKQGGRKDVVAELEKRFGKGVVMRMTDDADLSVKVVSTGSLAIDLALGIGGLPRGRIVEVYGPEASGKTTLTLHVVAEMQRAGHIAAFVDAEHALDLGYAKKLGVQVDELLVSQPDSGEDALDIAEVFARSGQVGVVVIDSVAALTPRAELEGEMGDAQVGLQARLMGKALRKLTAAANTTGTTIVFVNQLRQKIGVMFGPSETTTGGNALKYYASVRLDIRRIGTLKDADGQPFGNRTRVKVAKNKLAPPFRKCEFDIIYGVGICRAGELLDLGVEHGVVDKTGAWYAWDGERLGQGRERSRKALIEAPERAERLEAAVRSAAGVGAGPGAAADETQATAAAAA